MKPVVEFHQVTFSYDKIPVLNQVNFSVKPQEFIGIIGPNGGGKTTALKLMLGFLSPKQGSITLMNGSPHKNRCQIGYVPQSMHYDKQFPITVLELVLLGSLSKMKWWGHIPKKEKDKALSTLEKVGLLPYKNRPFGSLSGGQAQKALIARAIVSHPKILLLDEPTANVDPKAENQIFQLLQSLKQSMTILIVTHNFEAIMHYTDRVLCFQKEVSSILPHQVCEHFALGMYHLPHIHPHKEPHDR